MQPLLPTHPLSIAPMIDWTYSLFRVFMRQLLPQALLYTDMQTVGAIQHNPTRALYYHPIEMPLALQIGGADLKQLVSVAKQAAQQGFVEVNLNLGCPSDKVQSGRFGACLMREPLLVADIIHAMKQAVSIPVTAKTRIGIDHDDSYEQFASFVGHLIDAGCDKLIVHARKAWLHGLNPKQNRTIPPINYDYVYRVKQLFTTTPVVVNGNIQTLACVQSHLQQVDGVMLGRLACDNPYLLAIIHHALYPDFPLHSRVDYVQQYFNFLQRESYSPMPMSLVVKPLLNMAHGLPMSRTWKAAVLAIRNLQDKQGIITAIQCLSEISPKLIMS